MPRDYIYYSDRKIRELDADMHRWWRSIKSLDVKVLGTGIGGTRESNSEERFLLPAMNRVWEDLKRRGEVGTIDEPKEFFHGYLPFNYGIFTRSDPPVFFLLGTTDQTIVALGGSIEHVRGHRGRIPKPDSGAQPVVLESDVVALISEAEDKPPEERQRSLRKPGDAAIHVAGMNRNRPFWMGSTAEFEILARRELSSRVHPPQVESAINVLIGSPIFVARI